jgi:prephenate dehydrogenase
LSNADALAVEIDSAIAQLEEVQEALRAGDRERLSVWNDAAAYDRRRLLESGLAGGRLVELRAAVPNRPGVIAQLALELGRAGVNITDMALYPAADMSEGVVAFWVAGEAEAGRAQTLVANLGFPVAPA